MHRDAILRGPRRNTRPVIDIDVDHFDAILVAGGQAPMFTFDTATGLHRKFVEF
jgi:putative intracellular protease/amidase